MLNHYDIDCPFLCSMAQAPTFAGPGTMLRGIWIVWNHAAADESGLVRLAGFLQIWWNLLKIGAGCAIIASYSIVLPPTFAFLFDARARWIRVQGHLCIALAFRLGPTLTRW